MESLLEDPNVQAFIESFRAEGRVEGRAEGQVRGEAHAILAVLEERGIEVSDWARRRIEETMDHERLHLWLRRAVKARRLEDVLDTE